jgi:hypothetical protein
MDSDAVTSINDTTESKQVATCVQVMYDQIVQNANLPEHYTLFQLGQTSASTPTIMTKPAKVDSINWVRYNNATLGDTSDFKLPVRFLALDKFMALQSSMMDQDDTAVVKFNKTIDSETIVFKCFNNNHPKYYTTYDDTTLVFDSFDSTVDTYLTAAKSLAWGREEQAFSMTDGFTPVFDPETASLLFNEAKALAFVDLKQMENAKTEKNARRGWIHNMRAKRAVDQDRSEIDRLPNYGRPGGLYRATYFTKTERSGP